MAITDVRSRSAFRLSKLRRKHRNQESAGVKWGLTSGFPAHKKADASNGEERNST